MDGSLIDRLTSSFTASATRRGAMRSSVAGLLAVTGLGTVRGEADARTTRGSALERQSRLMQSDGDGGEPEFDHVSTGRLPSADLVQTLISDAHERFASNDEGEILEALSALPGFDRDLFAISVAETNGHDVSVGDADFEFPIMSVSKPFVFALVCQEIGPEDARAKLGANSTGLPFNSLTAVEQSPDGRTNPMVNAGAIMTTSLIPGATADEQWTFIEDGLAQFAGRKLSWNREVYEWAINTNFPNRAAVNLLHSLGRMYSDPIEALNLYTRQNLLEVSARDLAVMGATLANGGVNPVTRQRVVDPAVCHYTLAIMATAGLYETSGDWLYEVGLPGKSGVSGGIVTVSPGKGGMATFAPPLDRAGNSVKGQLVAKYLSPRLGMDLFISRPED